MSKIKYYYDEEHLEYRRILTSSRVRIRNLSIFIAASFLFGLLSTIILLNTSLIDTPKEISQAREINQYKKQFSYIDKKMDQMEKILLNIEERDNNIYRLYFESTPITKDQRREGFYGINRYNELEGFDNTKIIKNSVKRLEILQKQAVVQSISLDEVSKLAKNKEKLLRSIPAIQPINNKDLTRIASGYGWRTDPFTKARKMHGGIDFTAPRGTPVYASGDGIILRADSNSSGYGRHIRINHGYGYVSLYAHLNNYNVKKGQHIARGDLIGFVGSTGRSQGPHLHYEIYKDKVRINPVNFYYGSLTPDEFQEVLKVSSQENQSLD